MELEIFTERLRLTPFVADDIDLALEMWTDPDVVKYICDVMTEAEIRQEMPNSTKRGGNGGIGLNPNISVSSLVAVGSPAPSNLMLRYEMM